MIQQQSLTRSRSDLFSTYSKFQRNSIVLTCALLSALTPFTDTIYLPALKSISSDLDTTDSVVSLSVSIYLACVGIGQVIWGPLSDRYGRLSVLTGCLIAYQGITIAIIFAQTISILIVERAIQGFVVGTTIVSAQVIISDVFPPAERGAAMGRVLGPMLLGPIIAPLIGGILSQEYTWRSTFIFLAVLNCFVFIAMFAFIPETHHWYLGLIAQNAEDAIKIQNNTAVSQEQEQGSREENKEARIVHSDTVIMSESDSFSPHEDQKMDSASQEAPVTMKITVDNDSYICDDDDAKDEIISPPAYVPPWIILQLIFDSETFLTYAMNALAFATMFTSLTVLPVYLAIEPYNLSPGLVGVTYLPVGVAMMSGAMLGGQLSDYSAVTFRSAKEGRMLYPVALACGLTVGSIGFGLTLFYGTNLAGPLLTQSLLGFCESILMPSTTAYLTSKSPDKAGAASACLFFLCFVLAAISVSFSLIISNAIGVQFFFITLGLTTFALMVLSLLQYRGAVIRGDLRAASKRSTSQLSVNL